MIQGVIQILLNDSRVSKAVGAGKSGKIKIFPVLVDQSEDTPFVAMLITGNEPNQCKDSVSVLDKVRFEISTFSKDYPALDLIDSLMRFSLDGYKGVSAGIDLDIWFETHRDGFDSNMFYARTATYSAFVKRLVI